MSVIIEESTRAEELWQRGAEPRWGVGRGEESLGVEGTIAEKMRPKLILEDG